MRSWEDAPSRLIGGRLAIQIGAPRLGRRLHLLAFRGAPAYPEAIYYHARYRLDRFGPFSCWQFLRRHPDWSDAPPELHADWLSLNGFVAARLRDFDRAERWLNRAESVAPMRPWPLIERASAYEMADRLDDALGAARRSRELQPWSRPGVQATAHLLVRLNRERDALEFLTEAAEHLESGLVVSQLAALQNELGLHREALRGFDRYVELSPMMEPEVASWLAARRADTFYRLGEPARATELARQADDPVYAQFAERLEQATSSDAPFAAARKVLTLDRGAGPMPGGVADWFARYWNIPLAGFSQDSPPPPDGLPDAAFRSRAEEAGWAVREFTLTGPAAASLIDRGVPFVVTLVEAGFSQPRIVVGADAIKNTLFLAEPLDSRPTEIPLASIVDRFRSSGPRCLALVPPGEKTRLELGASPGEQFPESELYDLLFAVQKRLPNHDRPRAAAELMEFQSRFPEHRLTRIAALALARYDGHPILMLDVLKELLADYPGDSTLLMAKATVLRDLNRNGERIELLESAGSRTDAEPLLMQSLAQVWLLHPDRQSEADRLLRRSLRLRPVAPSGYFLLATQWWNELRFDDATEVYRFAYTLDDREDQFADAYFRAALATDQVPEAVRLFQQRAGRASVPTPTATRALYHALMNRDEPEQAFAALDQSIRKLQVVAGSKHGGPVPDPGTGRERLPPGRNPEQSLGELLLFRAECHAAFERFTAAEADLQAAKSLVPPTAWHQSAARIARLKPDLAAATVEALELLRHDPLHFEGQRSVVALLSETEGRAAGRTHLAQACLRFPHCYPLLKLRASFLSGDPEADADAVIDEMLALCPEDGWAWRQRALILAERKQYDEALAAAAKAKEVEPGSPLLPGVLAQVQRRADHINEAIATLRDALHENIDQDTLIAELVDLSRGRDEKLESLDFILEELRTQPHTGEGLVAYVAQAHQVYTEVEEHQDLLEALEDQLDRRPDLWQVWSVTIQQMAGLNRLEEAQALAREATARFPLLGKLWLDRAQVCHALANSDGRLDALREAVAVSPGWPPAIRELAEALEGIGETEEAVAALRRNVARAPTDPMAHGFLAEWLWEAGESREALARVKTAIRHEPGYEWAWHMAQVWAERLECPDEPIELAREMTRERPGDPRVWLRLARILVHPRHNEEVLAALDRVIAIDSRSVEAHDLRAERLAEMGRFEEALSAAQPPQMATDLPFLLQGRVAWVEAKRGNYAAAIPPMHALVSVDPKYVWGWHQLAEWYNETGRPQGYLEAASELARLQPGHPVYLTMRGEAKILTGDRDGGKADLRDALKVAAGYSPAAAYLFDAHLEDEEFREARQVLALLQEHLAAPEVAVKQLQLACKTGDAEGAGRAFAEVCEGPGQTPYPIQAGLTEMRIAGWEERAQRILREAWQNGGPFHPWAPLFWIESDEGEAAEPGERLRAVEAVIKAYPKFIPGHDTKAEQLGLAGRFEEALAACRPSDLGDPPPIELRGRAAWIESRRGDRARAIAQMKTLVAEDPTFVVGWRQLAAWYDTAGRYREFLDASEQYVKLEPQNPIAYVYRGEARKSLGDRRGALADFAKAFEIDPGVEVAGMNLITEQLATGDVAGAAGTLETLREHADGPLVQLRAVQVACHQGDADPALLQLRDLAADPETPRGVLREALAAFDAQGWGNRATAELKDLAFADEANPELAGLWAERTALIGTLDSVADRLPELLTRNPAAARKVILAYAWAVAESGKPVQGIVQKHSDVLRADDDSWARAGEALVAAGHFALAAAWLADYRDRSNLEAWMLRPLTIAYRALDQDDRAIEVCRAAVRVGGPDETLAEFRAWLALDFALSGQAEEAAAQVAKVDAVTVPDGTRLILSLAQALLMVLQAGPGGKSAAFVEAKELLHNAAGSCPAAKVPVGSKRAYRKVVARISGEAGSVAARIWAVRQRLSPWVK